jgi:hypothetical protein
MSEWIQIRIRSKSNQMLKYSNLKEKKKAESKLIIIDLNSTYRHSSTATSSEPLQSRLLNVIDA